MKSQQTLWKMVINPLVDNEKERKHFRFRRALAQEWSIGQDVLSNMCNDKVSRGHQYETFQKIDSGLKKPNNWTLRLWNLCHEPYDNEEEKITEVIEFLKKSGYSANVENFHTGQWVMQKNGRNIKLPPIEVKQKAKGNLEALDVNLVLVPLIHSLDELPEPKKRIAVSANLATGGKVFVLMLREKCKTDKHEFEPGDGLIVDPDIRPENHKIVFARIDGREIIGDFSRYGGVTVIRNQTIGEITSDQADIEIIGMVISWIDNCCMNTFVDNALEK